MKRYVSLLMVGTILATNPAWAQGVQPYFRFGNGARLTGPGVPDELKATLVGWPGSPQTVGDRADARIQVEGAIGDVSFELYDGALPNNLALSRDGTITGQFLDIEDYRFTIAVRDSREFPITQFVRVSGSVIPQVPVVGIEDVAGPVIVGEPFATRAFTVNGVSVSQWSLAPGKPGWLSIAADGTITGVPDEEVPSFSFTAVGTDYLGRSGEASRTFALLYPFARIGALSTPVMEGSPVGGTLETNLPNATWSKGGEGPEWLTISPDGRIGGTPGDYAATVAEPFVAVARGGGAVRQVAGSVTVTAGATAVEDVPGTAFSGYRVRGRATTTLGEGARFELAGQPAWLSIDHDTGAITGTAPVGGSFSGTRVVATKNGAVATSAAFGLAVTTATASVPGNTATSVQEADAFSTQASTNLPSPTWSLAGSPAWLAINPSTGVISGVAPDVSADTPQAVRAVAVSGDSRAEVAFDLTVTPAPVPVSITRPTLYKGQSFAGKATSPFGAGSVYSLENAPAGMVIAADGTIQGTASGEPGPHGGILVRVSKGAYSAVSAPFAVEVVAATSSISEPSKTVLEGVPVSFTAETNLPGATWALTGAPAWLTVAGNTFSGASGDIAAAQTHSVTATATEPGGASTSVPFTITVNPAAATVALSATTVFAGQPITGATSTSWGDGAASGATFALVNAPAWLAINPATGALSTPEGVKASASGIQVRATKGTAVATSAAFAITATATTATVSDAAPTVTEGDIVSVKGTTNITDATWALTGAPAWLTVSGDTFSGTSGDIATAQTHTVTATASKDGASQSASFTLTVNPATAAVAGLPATVYVGQTMTGTATTTLGAGRKWSLVGAPAWLAIDPDTGVVTAAPKAGDTSATGVKARAVLNGAVAEATFSVPVAAPTATISDAAPTILEGTAVSVSGTTNLPGATWTLSGAPAWLTVSGNTFSGTAADVTTAQSWDVTATAAKDGAARSVAFKLTVNPASATVAVSSNSIIAGQSITGTSGTSWGNGAAAGATYSLVNAPAWMTINASTGAISTAAGGATGPASNVIVRATRNGAIAESAAFGVAVATATASVSDTAPTTVEGVAVSLTGTTNIPGAVWTLSGAPAWMTVSGSTFSGTPGDVASAQTYDVTATAAKDGASQSATFKLTVNPASATVALSSTSVFAGQPVSGTTSTTWGNGAASGAAFALVNAPAWLEIDASTGAVSTKAGGATATATGIQVRATRNGAVATSAAFGITVTNGTASVSNTTPSTTEGNLVSLTGTTNITGATWTLSGGPAWLTVTNGNTFSGTPGDVSAVQAYDVTATAAKDGASASATFRLTVNPATATASVTPTTVTAGQNVTGTSSTTLGSGATFALVNAPAWLQIDASTGAISTKAGGATATATGIAVQASKNGATATTATFGITVAAATASVNDTTPDVLEGSTVTVTGTTNIAGAVWTLTGAPAWLTVSGNTFSGTAPDVSAVQTYNVTATAAKDSASKSVAFTLTVNPASTTTTVATTSLVAGQSVSGTSSTTLGTGAVFSLVNAPAWLEINAASGAVSTKAGGATVGTSTGVVVRATRNGAVADSAAFNLTVAGATASVDNAAPAIFEGNTATVTGTSNIPGATWTLSGAPAWFTATGNVFSGTAPDMTTMQTWEITATAAKDGASASATFTLTVRASAVVLSMTTSVFKGQPATGQASVNMGAGTVFSLVNAPTWLTINASTGAITTAPGGAQATASNVYVEATKNGAVARSNPFTLTVTDGTASVDKTANTVVEGNAVSVVGTTNITGAAWTLSGNPAWLTVSGNTFSGTAPDVTAAQSWTVTATAAKDGASASATFTVTVNPGSTTVTGLPGTIYVGQTVTGTATSTLAAGRTFALVNAPAWLSIAANGTITAAPAAGAANASNVIVRASLNGAVADSAPFSITVGTATASVSNATPTIFEGQAVSLTGTTNMAGATWTLSGGPAWLTVTNGNTFSGTHSGDLGTAQTWTVTATATKDGASASATFTLRVNPAAATVAMSSASIIAGQSVTGTTSTSWGAGAASGATFALVNAPAWMSINASTGAISTAAGGAPAGSYTGIQVTATRNGAVATSAAFGVNVAGATASVDNSDVTVVEGNVVTVTGTTNIPNANWTLSGNPAWFTASGNTFSGTSPDVTTTQTWTVTATASKDGATKSVTFTITVTPAKVTVGSLDPAALGGIPGLPEGGWAAGLA